MLQVLTVKLGISLLIKCLKNATFYFYNIMQTKFTAKHWLWYPWFYYESNESSLYKSPFHIGYQEPHLLCVTRNDTFFSNQTTANEFFGLEFKDRHLMNETNWIGHVKFICTILDRWWQKSKDTINGFKFHVGKILGLFHQLL